MRQAGHQVESERQRTSCECCSWAAGGMLDLVVHIESWSALSLAGLPWVSPSPAHVTTRLSDGAQKTSSPASWGQAKGPDSAPEQDSSLTAGATSAWPHESSIGQAVLNIKNEKRQKNGKTEKLVQK